MDEKAELPVLLCEACLIFLHAFLQNSIFWMGKRCWELDGREKRTIKLKSQGFFFLCIESSIPQLFIVYISKPASWIDNVLWKHFQVSVDKQIWPSSIKPLQQILQFVATNITVCVL